MFDAARSVRLSLKLHRFEFGAALIATFAVAVWAWSISLRSDASGLSPACVAQWAELGPSADPTCTQAMRSWGAVLEAEGHDLYSVLALLPFGVGLIAGVPIVAGELESGTARTAWWLYRSRSRWLARRVLPILVPLGLGLTALALGTDAVERAREIYGYSPLDDLGRYGFVLLADAFLAFSIGLAVGSLVGRVLPALILAVALTVALEFLTTQVHDAWLRSIPPVMISRGSGPDASDLSPGAIRTGTLWQAPDGSTLAHEVALIVAHDAGVPPPGPGDIADSAALEWLEGHGYVPMMIGVPMTTALTWGAWDMTGKIAGAALFGFMAAYTVGRRKPA